MVKYELFLKKNAEELEKSEKNNSVIDKVDTENNININNVNSNNSSLGKSKNKSINQSIDYDKSNQNIINQSIHINYDPNYLLEIPDVKKDYAKIGAFGYDHQDFYDQINFINREIRLRLSRRKYQKLKQLTLHSITYYDLFGLRNKNVNIKIYNNLLHNPYTCLEALKLMNVITNENKGRTYMLSKPSLIDEIVKVMIREETDSEIRQNCLGIVQKFTLRSEPQKRLIDLDVILWVTNTFIASSNSISDYTLEYGLALLMNLSLRSSGRDKCELVSEKLLRILIIHLKSESIQVRTCINGTLFSLLKRQKIKLEARALGLEKLLASQLQNPNEQMKKQIQYILDELKSDVEQEEKFDEEFEDENYGDEEEYYDDEYYEEDSINGNMLILHYKYLEKYIIKTQYENQSEVQKIMEFINNSGNTVNRNMISNNSASIRRDEFDRPLRRPTTPMTNLSSTSNSQIFNAGKFR